MKENCVVSAELGISGPFKLVDDPEVHCHGMILVAIIQEIEHKVVRESYDRELGRNKRFWGDVTHTRFLMRHDEEHAVAQAQTAQSHAEQRALNAEREKEEAVARSDSLKETLDRMQATEDERKRALAQAEGRVRDEMKRNNRLETELGKQRRDLGRIKKALGQLKYDELVGAGQ